MPVLWVMRPFVFVLAFTWAISSSRVETSLAMADGFKLAVIAEYSSQLPNLEMVRYVKVVFQPGGKLDNI